jgi:hypothetical protein
VLSISLNKSGNPKTINASNGEYIFRNESIKVEIIIYIHQSTTQGINSTIQLLSTLAYCASKLLLPHKS